MANTPEWDFEEYSMPGHWIGMKSQTPGEATLLFQKENGNLKIGIVLGDHEKWFPLTEDGTEALADYLEGRPFGTGAAVTPLLEATGPWD